MLMQKNVLPVKIRESAFGAMDLFMLDTPMRDTFYRHSQCYERRVKQWKVYFQILWLRGLEKTTI